MTYIFLALFFQSAFAGDAYNTYLWNRHNVKEGNGHVDRRDWYEWWYYKVVDPQTRDAFFFTYGVINPWDHGKKRAGTKAVVSAGDFKNHILVDVDFPLSEFSARYDRTEVRVGANEATDKHLFGHIFEGGHEVAWDLKLEREWRFNAMGWATFVRGVSGIYWYPAQASARMSGWVRVDGRTHTLKDAPAYQDRNWGRSFPKWWTWLTSNHFAGSPGTVFAAGGCEPKAFNSVYLFAGLCVGLKHQGKEYIFRTTDADPVQFDIRWGVWSVVAENKKNQRIEVSAYAPPDQFMMLPFQSPRGPVFYDYEALLGKMTVKVFERKNSFSKWRQVAVLVTDEAGIEWGTPEPLDSSAPFGFQKLFQSSSLN